MTTGPVRASASAKGRLRERLLGRLVRRSVGLRLQMALRVVEVVRRGRGCRVAAGGLDGTDRVEREARVGGAAERNGGSAGPSVWVAGVGGSAPLERVPDHQPDGRGQGDDDDEADGSGGGSDG